MSHHKIKLSLLILLGLFVSFLILRPQLAVNKTVLGTKSESEEDNSGQPTSVQNTDINPTISFTPTPTLTPTLTPTPTNTPTPTSTPTPSLTPTPTPTPTDIIAPLHIENYFNQYAGHYGVNPQIIKRVAYCESRFNVNAVNGDYVGLFQFNETAWVNYRTQMGHDTNPDLRLSGEESIKTAAFAISKGKLYLWPNCI